MADLRFRYIEDYAGGLLNISRQEISTTGEVLSQDGLTTEGTIFVEDGSGVKSGLKLGVSLAEAVDPTTEMGIVNVRYGDRTYAKVRDLRIFTTAIASAQSALSEATSTSISNLETAFQLLEDDINSLEENLQSNISNEREKIQELTINQNQLVDRVDDHDTDIQTLASRVAALEEVFSSTNTDTLSQPFSIELPVLISSRGNINNESLATIFSDYLETPALAKYSQSGENAVGLQVGVGLVAGISGSNTDPGAIEFYKTRNTNVRQPGTIQKNDAIGALHFSGSNGIEPVLGGSFYCNIGENWSTTANSTWFRFRYAGLNQTELTDKLLIGYPQDDSDTDVGPNTITIPFVPTTVAPLSAGWDSDNRLVKSGSSIKYKTQVEDIESEYVNNALNNLRPVWYRSKTAVDNSSWSWYGLIAEEVAEIDPRLVHWGYANDQYIMVEDGLNQYKRVLKEDAILTPEGVQYDRIGVLLLKIVKQQQQQIEELSNQIKNLISN